MQNVVVYTTPTCTYCRQAKAYFNEKGVPFVEKDVSADRVAAIEMIRRSGQQGVPVIVIGDETIVGFDRRRIDRALEATAARRPSLGLSVADASKITARQGGVPLFGAYVGRVAPGSAGEKAGIQPGDIITELNMRPVRNADDVEKAMQAAQPGGLIQVIWTRGQQTLSSEVRL